MLFIKKLIQNSQGIRPAVGRGPGPGTTSSASSSSFVRRNLRIPAEAWSGVCTGGGGGGNLLKHFNPNSLSLGLSFPSLLPEPPRGFCADWGAGLTGPQPDVGAGAAPYPALPVGEKTVSLALS